MTLAEEIAPLVQRTFPDRAGALLGALDPRTRPPREAQRLLADFRRILDAEAPERADVLHARIGARLSVPWFALAPSFPFAPLVGEAVAFTPDGTAIAVCEDGGLALRDLRSGSSITRHAIPVLTVNAISSILTIAFGRDAQSLACTKWRDSGSGRELVVVTREGLVVVEEQGMQSLERVVSFADGAWFASGGSWSAAIRVHDAKGEPVKKFSAPVEGIESDYEIVSLAGIPKSDDLLVIDDGGTLDYDALSGHAPYQTPELRRWNVTTATSRTLVDDPWPLMAVSPDGTRIATTSHQHVAIRDIEGAPILELAVEAASGLAFLDAEHLLVASKPKEDPLGRLRLWSAVHGDLLADYGNWLDQPVQTGAERAVIASPDGRWIATAGRTQTDIPRVPVRLWARST